MVIANLTSCADFWADMLLVLLYTVALIAVVYLTVKLGKQIHLCGPQRKPQKIFLFLLFIQTSVRVLYFSISPFYYQTCDRMSLSAPFVIGSVFGTLPSFIFLTAFSVLLFTFARIFHTVLRAGQPRHRFVFRVLAFFLIILNCACYVMACWQYVLDYQGKDDTVVSTPVVLLLVAGACIVGVLFSTYSVMLFSNYNVLIQNARAEVARSQSAIGRTPPYAGADVQTSPDVHTAVLVNPMKRLAFAACLTSVCFLVRAGILLYRYYSTDHQEGVSGAGYIVYVIYFFLAEIIPEFLLLVAFNTLIGSNTTVADQQRDANSSNANTPLLSGNRSIFAPAPAPIIVAGNQSPRGFKG